LTGRLRQRFAGLLDTMPSTPCCTAASEEHGTIALEMLAVANGEKRLDDLKQHRPAFDRFALLQFRIAHCKESKPETPWHNTVMGRRSPHGFARGRQAASKFCDSRHGGGFAVTQQFSPIQVDSCLSTARRNAITRLFALPALFSSS